MHKLVVTDLDGTLSSSSRIVEPEVREKIEEFYSKGWTILFSTGRSCKYAEDLVSSFSCPYFLATQNGACLLDPQKNIIAEHFLSKNWLPALIKETEKFSLSWWIESGFSYQDVIFVDNHANKEIFSYIFDNYFPKESEKKFYVRKLNTSLLDYPYDFFAVAKTIGPLAFIQDIAKELHEIFHHVCNITNILVPRYPDFGMIHITHKEASKGKVLSQLISTISAEKNVFTIVAGDDQNDHEMIQQGHFKIVMATAPQFMLELADYIALSAKENGLIKGLEEGEKVYLKQLLEK